MDPSSWELTAVLMGITVMVLNVLDSVTTALAFKQYPDKALKGEGNPFMRRLMLKNRLLAEVIKQGAVLAVVIFGIVFNQVIGLRQLSILLGLVVINNSWIVISRAVTKRKVLGPSRMLQRALHIPNKYLYIVVVVVLGGLAYLINMVM